jgi:cytidine deaminase
MTGKTQSAALAGEESDLVGVAVALLRTRYVPHSHAVAAALRSASGRTYTGLHLGAGVARAAICAEAVALGMAVMADDLDLINAVAVHYHPEPPGWKIVSPCGVCRELLCFHVPRIVILLPPTRVSPILRRVPIEDLLPDKFTRE